MSFAACAREKANARGVVVDGVGGIDIVTERTRDKCADTFFFPFEGGGELRSVQAFGFAERLFAPIAAGLFAVKVVEGLVADGDEAALAVLDEGVGEVVDVGGGAGLPDGEVDAPVGGDIGEATGVEEDSAVVGEGLEEAFAEAAVLTAGEPDGVAEEGEVAVGEVEAFFDLDDAVEELGEELLCGGAHVVVLHFSVDGGEGASGLVGAVLEVVGGGVGGIDEEEEGLVGFEVGDEGGGQFGEEVVDRVVEEVEEEFGGLGVVGLAEVELGGFVGGGVEAGEAEVAGEVAGAPGAVPDDVAVAPVGAEGLRDEEVGVVDEDGGGVEFAVAAALDVFEEAVVDGGEGGAFAGGG